MLFRFMFFCLSLGSLAGAVELQQATNDQILNEVSRRMSGGAGGSSAAATFSCAADGWLFVEISGIGGSDRETVRAGGYSACLAQAEDLRPHKTHVTRVTIAAACSADGWLFKLPLSPDGTIGSPQTTNSGGYNACIQQAKSINAQ